MNIVCNSFGGYCTSYAVFKAIDDKDIEAVEEIVRREVKDFFQSKSITLPHGSTSEDAFGRIYALNPSQFKFLQGDRKLIKIIINYVNDIEVQNKLTAEDKKSHKNSFNESHFLNQDVQQTLCLLNKLQEIAQGNLNRPSEGFRYANQTKMIAAYIRMICGRLAYNTIQKNLQGVLPSIVSTNRYIKSPDSCIVEGEIRGKQLLKYLKDRGLPLVIVLSDDATRVVGRIQYDSPSNQIIGFVLPIDKQTGMPITNSYPARNAEEILKIFSAENSISSYVIAIMAQPLADVPPFCLAMFGSDSSYTSDDVEHRWKYITSELKKLNIEVIAISSDSDPKYNRVMRKLSSLGSEPVPGLKWFSCDTKNIKPPFYVQDPTHIGTKLRNFLLRFHHKKIPFSPTLSIQLDHLYTLLNTVSKDQHFLTASTLNPSDRQNFSSVLRMCSEKVTSLLQLKIENSQATIIYLEMIRNILDSFMNTSLNPLERVSKIWYSVFILRIWKQFIKSQKKYKMKDSFLTSNCYSCIELNAHSLVLCLVYLKENNLPSWFQPSLSSSQPCESTFRRLRSFTSTYSTVANCSVKEALSRVSKIQLQNEIVHSHATYFDFLKTSQQNNGQTFVHELPTRKELVNVIDKSKNDAIRTAIRLGFKIAKNSELSCDLSPVSCIADKKKKTKKSKKKVQTMLNGYARKLTISDLRNAHLKNYATQHSTPDEKSPFVKIDDNKVFKISAVVWYFRIDYQKMSSDRNRRVMALTENEFVNKNRTDAENKVIFKCPIYRHKSKFSLKK